jgi:hypothetical protein
MLSSKLVACSLRFIIFVSINTVNKLYKTLLSARNLFPFIVSEEYEDNKGVEYEEDV